MPINPIGRGSVNPTPEEPKKSQNTNREQAIHHKLDESLNELSRTVDDLSSSSSVRPEASTAYPNLTPEEKLKIGAKAGEVAKDYFEKRAEYIKAYTEALRQEKELLCMHPNKNEPEFIKRMQPYKDRLEAAEKAMKEAEAEFNKVAYEYPELTQSFLILLKYYDLQEELAKLNMEYTLPRLDTPVSTLTEEQIARKEKIEKYLETFPDDLKEIYTSIPRPEPGEPFDPEFFLGVKAALSGVNLNAYFQARDDMDAVMNEMHAIDKELQEALGKYNPLQAAWDEVPFNKALSESKEAYEKYTALSKEFEGKQISESQKQQLEEAKNLYDQKREEVQSLAKALTPDDKKALAELETKLRDAKNDLENIEARSKSIHQNYEEILALYNEFVQKSDLGKVAKSLLEGDYADSAVRDIMENTDLIHFFS